MRIKGWNLDYFNTGEWQVCDERLRDLERVNRRIGRDGYLPGRSNLFKALHLVQAKDVRVAIIGQDPYPQEAFATGLAFSIPDRSEEHSGRLQTVLEEVPASPPTLKTILKEYSTDLGLPIPRSGNLARWSENGVLLWNAIPSCLPGRSLSHDWPEYEPLTREICRRLSEKGIVFALLGQVARRFQRDIDLRNNKVIVTSHPSPRGSLSSKSPFVGSRLFSTINARLVENAQEPIDWKLP